MNILPGQSYKLNLGKGNPNNKTMHIRAVVDDEAVVYRVWSRHKQGWRYKLDTLSLFAMYDAAGCLGNPINTPPDSYGARR